MNVINKFNLTKTAFMSHGFTTEKLNKEKSEKSFKLFFSPMEKKTKNGGFKKLNIAYPGVQTYY